MILILNYQSSTKMLIDRKINDKIINNNHRQEVYSKHNNIYIYINK